MSRSRVTAVAIALALATVGCGIGPGGDVGEVSLTVTRDFGAERLLGPATERASESDTVMRLLDRRTEITTLYSGDFVRSIDGIAEARKGSHPFDWLFYVNGVESPVGAAEYALHDGDRIWWDYRDWSAAVRVPAVVGSWPEPFRHGYEGKRHPVAVECLGGGAVCREVRSRLRAAGASLAAASGEAVRILVGPWARLREDPTAAQVEQGPGTSGVYAEPVRMDGGFRLIGLDEGGEEARRFGPDAGLVAATRRYDAPPVWVVTGASLRGVATAARSLDPRALRDHYAVAVEGGHETPLPIGAAAG
jgi:uncharacterized protein DUF4430